jgi:SAM-dependent methyltransferase
MSDIFLEEYSAQDAVLRYTKETAGYGISYLLEHDYGKIYREVLDQHIPQAARQDGMRILEFGCGGGMNLIYLVSLVEQLGIGVRQAYGTDFSQTLIQAANLEADRYLAPAQRKRVKFLVARNETLAEDLATQHNVGTPPLYGSFHLILGVNTIRYCHRLGKQVECAQGIFALLDKGGVCVIVDMNDKFLFFRSRLREWRTRQKPESYLPSIEEYAHPFTKVGFDILYKGNFCWIPHSAGPWLSKFCKGLTPLLDAVMPAHAMRSLIIAHKPVEPGSFTH